MFAGAFLALCIAPLIVEHHMPGEAQAKTEVAMLICAIGGVGIEFYIRSLKN
jgi:hypothetical protein